MERRKMLYYHYEKKDKLWTQASLAAAVKAYHQNEFSSLRECASHFHLSKTTLIRALQVEKGEKVVTHQGRKPVLGQEEEHDCAGIVATMARSGFPVTSAEVPGIVGQYCDTYDIATPWENNIPGRRWVQQFAHREHLVVKKAQTISLARSRALKNPFTINRFYDIVEAELDKLGLRDRPDRIYNCDETGFPHDPTKLQVVVRQGEECLNVILGAGRENTTVLACCCADGTVMPPYVIFKGANRPDEARIFNDKETGARHKNIVPGTDYTVSENGWIDTELFNEWFTHQFLPRAQTTDEPILLLFDGHLSHVSVQLIKKARESQVTILKLPPHTSSVLQPLDVACFGPMKKRWQTALLHLKRRKQVLSKDNFCDQIGLIWPDGFTCQNIQAGFAGTGIYPCDRGKYPVAFDPILQEKYDKWISDGKPEREDGEEFQTPNPSDMAISTVAGTSQPPSTPHSSADSLIDPNDDLIPPKPTEQPVPGYPQPSADHVASWTLAWVPVWVDSASARESPRQDYPRADSGLARPVATTPRTPAEKEAAFHKSVISTWFHSGPPKKQRKVNLQAEVITTDNFISRRYKRRSLEPQKWRPRVHLNTLSSAAERKTVTRCLGTKLLEHPEAIPRLQQPFNYVNCDCS